MHSEEEEQDVSVFSGIMSTDEGGRITHLASALGTLAVVGRDFKKLLFFATF